MTTPLVKVRHLNGSRITLPLLLLIAMSAPKASFAGVTYSWIPLDGSPSSGTLTIDAPRCGGFSVSQTAVSAFTFTFAPGLSVDLTTAQIQIVRNGELEIIPIVSSDGSSLDSGVLELRLRVNPGIRVSNTIASVAVAQYDPSGQNLVVRGRWQRALDELTVSSGDVAGLIAAIDSANSSGRDSRIRLEAGTYRLTAAKSSTDGPSGLPSITGTVVIAGSGQETTIIERERGTPRFRLVHVSGPGCLALQELTLRGGELDYGSTILGGSGMFNRGELGLSRVFLTENGFPLGEGPGGIRNEGGVLTIARSTISRNSGDGGGGVRNSFSGRVAITDTQITDNEGGRFGGGIWNSGELSLMRSTISNNFASYEGGAGIFNTVGSLVIRQSSLVGNRTDGPGGGINNNDRGAVTVSDTTIANNVSGDSGGNRYNGGGVINTGTVLFVNSTIAGNRAEMDRPDLAGAGGILNVESGVVRLQNTIVALNTTTAAAGFGGSDCAGVITSIARNLIGDPAGCTVSLGATDLAGDPGLGAFIDSGAPGTARVPLLPTSRAIDAGAACANNDQLQTPRLGACDLGAVEFYPVIDDVVALDVLSTAFDPTPVLGGPAGTLRISVKYTNNSGTTIASSFVEVSELSGDSLLLNASRSLFGPGQTQGTAAGGVGARVSLGNNGPGVSSFFDLVVGLATRQTFTLFVNVHGGVQHGGTP